MTHRPPRILLLGDTARLAFQRHVAEALRADGLAVVFPEASTGRAACLEDTLETYLDRFDPDMVCFAAAPMAREELLMPSPAPEPEAASMYRSQLQRIAERCVRRCGRQVVFVSMAPVDAERLARRGPAWARARATNLATELTAADQIGRELAAQLNVMTDDLDKALSPRLDEFLEADGVTLSGAGAAAAGEAVAGAVYGVM